MLHVREIAPTRSALGEFVRFPLMLYKDDPRYAPLPTKQQVRGLLSRRNALVSNGVQSFLMAYEGERPVGRLLAGIDFRAVSRLGERQGYLSLFECVDSQGAADALFEAAKAFLRLNGITSIVGPSPVLYDDFDVGLQVEGYEEPSMFLSPYNPPYYSRLFEAAGFVKHRDYFSYTLPLDRLDEGRYEDVLRRAGKRFGYTVENVTLRRDVKRRAREFARVIAESTPPEWEVAPPTYETLYRELKPLRKVLWPDYVLMAYAGERPIGLLLNIPDVSVLLRGLKGRMFPVGTFRRIFARAYVKRLRTAMLYVVPDYHNKGVESMLVNRALSAARANGVRYAEASLVNERNLKLQVAVEKLGGRVTKVFRQYRLDF